MVKIRLRRVGAKNRPMYRVVVTDARAPRDGAFIEIIGHFNPLTDPEAFTVDEDKALKWLKQGAQPTDTVARLLSKSGVMEKFKQSQAKKPKSRKSTTARKTTTRRTKSTKTQSATEEPSA